MSKRTAASPATCPPRQHVLILDLAGTSAITTKKIPETPEAPRQGHLSFDIPQAPTKGEDCWDLFMTRDGSARSVRAVSPSELSEEGEFIGRLNLHQLGFWDRKKRKDGKLGQARIVNTV